MAVIKPDPISLTTHQLHLGVTASNRIASSATGFIWSKGSQDYLVTNWHVVTGKDPNTGAFVSTSGAMPDFLVTRFRTKENLGVCQREDIPLYEDESLLKPRWLEHPVHNRLVDVVVLPLAERISATYRLFPITSLDFDTKYEPEVADEAFVVGYPFSDETYAQLPIWKRASIASEPTINVDQLPKLFIDTATRPGLSGSPVIMQRIGIHGMKDGGLGDAEFGRIRSFLGVYSGRIGSDELRAQLGIVWKSIAIDEIIDGGMFGSI